MKQLNLFNPTKELQKFIGFSFEINTENPTIEKYWFQSRMYETSQAAIAYLVQHSKLYPDCALRIINPAGFIIYVYDPTKNPASLHFHTERITKRINALSNLSDPYQPPEDFRQESLHFFTVTAGLIGTVGSYQWTKYETT